MSATYKDIQRLTGFSLSTISRHFNGEKVRPTTSIAIKEAAEQLNFKINDFARGLKSGKAMSVGLLIPNLNSVFCTTITYEVGRYLRQQGYGCFVCDYSSDKHNRLDAINFLIKKSVDGIIIVPSDDSPAQLELARNWGVPTVLIDNTVPSIETDAVVIDNFNAGKMAANHFLEKGHENVAIISGRTWLPTMNDRQRGFLSQFTESGHSAHLIETFFSIEEGYKAARKLLTEPSEITAVFCTNYELTMGVVTAMNELGIRFPVDISLIGFDNMELTRIIKPAITLVEQPIDQIAYCAADLLLTRFEGEAARPYETIVLAAKLFEGDSVADLRG